MTVLERETSTARLAAGAVEYRMEGEGPETVVIFHGGHMRAGLALGEEVFTTSGHRVLVPSRPGYGRTPLSTATTPAAFADVVAQLCHALGIERVAAVVGISAGGRTALTMAARHPDLAHQVILQSAVGFTPWPDRRTRLGGRLVFGARVEAVTWAAVRALMRAAPQVGLRLLLRDLSTRPIGQVMAGLSEHDRAELVALFMLMRSREGFVNDMLAVPDCAGQVTQPALVIASRTDRSVPFTHAESLAAAIPRAELVESRADGHMIWFTPDYPAIADRIKDFLTAA
ncbi:alpha/beta fold hydrolase [Streptosporangium sp. NBC_01756]|uniref:alpha/beta fold hydrolase n=1 Tax=Streptosporangium sp. NBC_01756 TaxID=2975950 RepID=UPI002DDB7AEA|nr:alpha/beta hydrolase [Streptosporangium sp. NBC_01756]WSC89582.1 alpha/beta hydrolase [Streptosporangium sp. NBC_01756]